MNTERKEPTVSSGAVKATNNQGIPSSNKRVSKDQSNRPVRAETQVIVQKQSSGLLWFTLLLTLLVSALAGYTFWQLQQSQELIGVQQGRINELENKLLITGDESTQSLTVLTSNVKDLDKNVKLAISEVDKLWATRNKNVKDIDTLRNSLGSSIKSLEVSLSKPVKTIEQQMSSQEIVIQSLRESIAGQEKQNKSLENQIKQFSSSIKKIDSVSKSVAGYEETIRSFDKFRLSTNRDLIALKERAGVL